VQLRFDPEVEYRIYRSVPHDLVFYCNRLRLPAGFIGGRHSDVLRQVGLADTRRSFRVKRIEGGHLFPFERPQAAAEAVRQLAAELLGKS
jgi:pimeloyl-ACP methyl ester carboxylesterase